MAAIRAVEGVSAALGITCSVVTNPTTVDGNGEALTSTVLALIELRPLGCPFDGP